jgi:hypothetical protein
VAPIRRSAELVNGSHIRVPQGSRSAGFTQKTFTHKLRAAVSRRHLDHFQGYLAVQHPIHSKVGHADCTATEFPVRAICISLDLEIAED